jgi:hypothetical protein
MTYQRVLSRNNITKGGYDADPVIRCGATSIAWSVIDGYDQRTILGMLKDTVDRWKAEAEAGNSKWRFLLGDLRRLEADAIDEQAACAHIAARTGVDPDTVAAVLKEFMSW